MAGRIPLARILLPVLLVPGCATSPGPTASSSPGGSSSGVRWPEWKPMSLTLLESQEGGTVIIAPERSTLPPVAVRRSPPPPPAAPRPSPPPEVRPVEEAVMGKPVRFVVSSDGSPPLSFQWRKDGQPIAGATEFTLAIQAVSAKDAGHYDCVVSNSVGAATSPSFELVVRPP